MDKLRKFDIVLHKCSKRLQHEGHAQQNRSPRTSPNVNSTGFIQIDNNASCVLKRNHLLILFWIHSFFKASPDVIQNDNSLSCVLKRNCPRVSSSYYPELVPRILRWPQMSYVQKDDSPELFDLCITQQSLKWHDESYLLNKDTLRSTVLMLSWKRIIRKFATQILCWCRKKVGERNGNLLLNFKI